MDSNQTDNKLLNINLSIISLFIIFYVLYIGSSFIIPFVISFFLAFFLFSFYKWILKFLKNRILSLFITFSLMFLFLWIFYAIIDKNIESIVERSSYYEKQFKIVIDHVIARIGIKEGELYGKIWSFIDFKIVFTYIANLVRDIVSYSGIILFYLVFIFLEYRWFDNKIAMMIKDKYKKKKFFDTLLEIREDIKSYFLIKTFISFLSAFFSYLFLIFIGVDFALFWAFLMFVLNFIPNIGSFISISFPIIVSVVQFSNSYTFLIVFIGLIFIDVFISNFVEPKLTGSRLNLSPLVILMSLVFWSLIWGIVGAILSVPIMVITSIIFSKFPQTRSIAILMSEKGELKSNIDKEFEEKKREIIRKIRNSFLR